MADEKCPFDDSKVLANSTEMYEALVNVLGQQFDKNWRKCYVGSEHKYASSKFHELCDNKGPTVTIVKSNNYFFGGYADHSWKSKLRKITTVVLLCCRYRDSPI